MPFPRSPADMLDLPHLARALFEESGDAQFLLDPQTDVLIDANPAALKLSGFTRDQLLNAAATYLFRHEAQGGTGQLRAALHHTNQHLHGLDGFLLRTSRDGVWIPVGLTVTRLHVEPKALGLITARDLREQKRLLEQLRASQEQLAHVIEAVADGIAFVDRDRRIRLVNASAERILGVARENLLGQHCSEIVADWTDLEGRPVPSDQRAGEIALGRGETARFRRTRVRPDGTRTIIDGNAAPLRGADGEIVGLVVSFTDASESHRAQEAIRTTERRYRDLFDTVGDFIFSVDLDGRILYVNRAWRETFGYTEAEALTMRWQETCDPESLASCERAVVRLLAGEAVPRVEKWFRTRDGRRMFAEGSLSLRRDADGRPVAAHAIYRDATARVLAEQALRASERRWRSLLEHSTDCIYIMDAEGRALYQSAASERVLGWAVGRDFAADRSLFELVHPDDLPAATAAMAAALAAPRAVARVTTRMRRPDGSYRVIEKVIRNLIDDPEIQGVVVNGRDATERAVAEEALAREHALLRGLIDSLPDPIYIQDTRGAYLACNPAFEAVSGRTERDLVGRISDDAFGAAAEWNRRSALDAILAGAASRRDESWHEAADGSRALYESTWTPLRSAGGEVAGVIGVSRDITQRRRLEDQLREAGKLEAIGQLAGGVAHDFNNLLTALLGNLDRADSILGPGHAAREPLAAVGQAAARAAELTRQLLGFARRSPIRLAPADLNAAVAETVGLLRHIIDPRVVVVARPSANLGPVLADAGQIGQVLMNLCLNARDAMPRGGTLTVETEEVVVDAAHVAREMTARPGKFARLRVSDTGVGIASDLRERVFEPFFTTKGPDRGTGLGLPMVLGIVQQHDGWVECASEVGRGTTFMVYLPRIETSAPASPAVAKTVAGRATILLADDEPMIRQIAQVVLEQQGFRVLLAEDGLAAIEVYLRERSAIDLVILDLTMPRMSGRDACREIVRIDPAARVMLSSGYAADQEPTMREAGVVAFLAKPYRPGELVAAARAALAAK